MATSLVIYIYLYFIIGLIGCVLVEFLMMLIRNAKEDGTIDELAEYLEETPFQLELMEMEMGLTREFIHFVLFFGWLPLVIYVLIQRGG
jgi:hypothetical protein